MGTVWKVVDADVHISHFYYQKADQTSQSLPVIKLVISMDIYGRYAKEASSIRMMYIV